MEQQQEILEHLRQMQEWEANGVPSDVDINAYVSDVLERWAPMAETLGMFPEQGELQELSMKLGHPEDYRHLKHLLQEAEMSCEMVFRSFALPIRAMLDELGIEYEFKYRMKSVYSIWRKMRVDNKCFDDVYDLFATRIVYKPKPVIDMLPHTVPNIVDSNPDTAAVRQWQLENMDAEKFYCRRIYTVISSLYRIHPDRVKDWITNPKPSGYQALQLTVMGPDFNWIEIQIRSERMDYDAEQGIAAHWKYKQEKSVQ